MTLIYKCSRSDHPTVPPAMNPRIAPLQLLPHHSVHMWSFMTSIGIQVFIEAQKCVKTYPVV